ncbi:MAG: LacI family DNA-binding transcriptional regulator [Flaviflexus sp.]|uniref:LacI family DNA-binding transcriptional regulator n=1 Tax=Flaviflexus sp. TaxID=1969482 RepID=UPI00352CDBF5
MNDSVTQRDIAEHAGVSRALVSMALSDSPKVAEETKAAILQAADELGYVRNLSASSLVNQVTPILGLILPDIANPYFESFFGQLQEESVSHDLLPLIATASNDPERERLVLQRFLELRVAGVIAVSPAMEGEGLRSFGERIPLVVVGQEVGGHVDSVAIDEEKAATLLANHFSSEGWVRAAYVYDDLAQSDRGLLSRREALTAACEREGLSFTPIVARGGMRSSLDDYLDSSDQPTVLIGHNDLIATRITAELRRDHSRSGVGVAGYDNTYLSREGNGDFTSISQPLATHAKQAIEFIESRSGRRYGSSRSVVAKPELIVRSSTIRHAK